MAKISPNYIAVVDKHWKKLQAGTKRKQAKMKGKTIPTITRAQELAAIEQFVATKGITIISSKIDFVPDQFQTARPVGIVPAWKE